MKSAATFVKVAMKAIQNRRYVLNKYCLKRTSALNGSTLSWTSILSFNTRSAKTKKAFESSLMVHVNKKCGAQWNRNACTANKYLAYIRAVQDKLETTLWRIQVARLPWQQEKALEEWPSTWNLRSCAAIITTWTFYLDQSRSTDHLSLRRLIMLMKLIKVSDDSSDCN